MKLTNKMYDALKYFALIALPALGSAVFSFGTLWGWSFTSKAVGSITIADTLLGGLLHLNKKNYDKSDEAVDGDIVVTGDSPEEAMSAIAFNENPAGLKVGDTITLRVTQFDPKADDAV